MEAITAVGVGDWLDCVEAGSGESLMLVSIEAVVAIGVEVWLDCVEAGGGGSLVLLKLEAVVVVNVVESIATMVATTDDERTDAIV